MNTFQTALKRKLLYYKHTDVNLQQIFFLGIVAEILNNTPNKRDSVTLYENCLIKIGFNELLNSKRFLQKNF